MEQYFIGINILKQFVVGVIYGMGSWSLCVGPFSVEVHPHNIGCNKKVSFYNEFTA